MGKRVLLHLQNISFLRVTCWHASPSKKGRVLSQHKSKEKERDVLFALIARVGAGHGKTSVAAFTKYFFSPRHLLARTSVQEREGVEPAQVIQDAYSTARYEAFYDMFSAAPLV
jgi:hypothetical protein